MSDELPANKNAARRMIRAGRRSRRAAADDQQWRAYGERLALGLTNWLEGHDAPRVAAIYESLPHEPPTHGIQASLVATGTRLIVPTLLADKDLSWRDLRPESGPASGPDLGVGAISDADLILVPGLAVARPSGIRLGQGGGSYDRALARKRPGTSVIAVLFDEEVVDAVPHEPHDRTVDAVLTPSGGVAEVG